MEVDEAVQATNDDASECKRCAVQLGYWEDRYIHHLVRGRERKAPEINRGYFARIKGVEMLLTKVLKKTGRNCQIINLGAGFDTTYWRLKDMGYNVVNFTELDFPSVTSKKCFYIKRNKALLDEIYVEGEEWYSVTEFHTRNYHVVDGEVRLSATDLHASNYHVVGVDLRNLIEVQQKLSQSEITFDVPTVFIAECVLVYIETALVNQLLSWIVSAFPTAFFINYEQVNMGDKFGEVMLNNLRARGCPLAGADACHSLDTQMHRLVTQLNDADVHVGRFSLDNGPDVVIASPNPHYLDYDSDIIAATPEPCSRVIVPTSRIPQQAHVPSERIPSQLNFLIYNSERYCGAPLLFVWPLTATRDLSIDKWIAGFTGTGWDGSRAWDMVEVYSTIPASERQRIEQLEFLDEQELLTQLFQHYCISTAWRGQLLSEIGIS
ncbi:Leucine carboxyl methyltransferase 1 [Homalodisca vitripennis]|nr:Leucine carboxyl methyltransferase 1 [Homalodisca vitripennis]